MNCTIPVETHQEEEWARIFIWTANSIGFVYNIPQVVHTVRTKKTGDISSIFLWLRFVSSAMWCFYSSYFFMYDVLISWAITLLSSTIILYYKYIYKPEETILPQIEEPPIIEQTSIEPGVEYDIIVMKDE